MVGGVVTHLIEKRGKCKTHIRWISLIFCKVDLKNILLLENTITSNFVIISSIFLKVEVCKLEVEG